MDKPLKNERFKVALDYLYREHLVTSDKELAEKIGISPGALSRIRNNKKNVGDDTLRKMNEAFGNIFNMAYFRGENIYMLMEDYISTYADQLGLKVGTKPSNQSDGSENFKAVLESRQEVIDGLRSQMSDLRSQMADLRIQIVEKDNRISELKQTISLLNEKIDAYEVSKYDKYPFPHGVAEEKTRPDINKLT